MLRVYGCIATEHDIRYVVLAAAICLLSMLTAFALARHIRDLGPTRHLRWVFLVGYVTGVGIWATHFVAMLAYQPGIPTAYSPVGTTLSVIVSIIMSVIGWRMNFSGRKHAVTGAAITITAGIAAMHFIGMSALKTQGDFHYDFIFVGVCVLTSWLLVNFSLRFRQDRLPRIPLVQAFMLTAAICVLHFGSMAAVTILPTGISMVPTETISRSVMVSGVATAVLILIGAAVFAVVLDLRFRRTIAEVSRTMSRDPITGLLNASAFERVSASMLCDDKKGHGAFAFARISLDGLRQDNDDHGRKITDMLLIELARRLEASCGTGIVGRAAGDEFNVLLHDGDPTHDLEAALTAMDRCMALPIEAEGVAVKLSVRVGVARYPEDAADWDELRRKAGFALYNAKYSSQQTYLEYNPTMERATAQRHELEAALREALPKGQFSVHYQPIACVQTGGVIGFEALLRWKHPSLGNVSPAQFIPVAEALGLIVEIGAWVLGEACREAAYWSQPVKVAVNLSAVQFSDPDLVSKIRAALDDSGLAPDRLELEITEGLLIGDPENAVTLLSEIRSLGVRIAMDDFGTGFSSLSYFRQFPFDKVKIDQSFIKDMIENRQSMAIVKAVIGLSRALDMIVLAEGVETAEQLDVLTLEGCHQVQGYLIGKPVPAIEYAALTAKVSTSSHPCGNRCGECLERLRPPCDKTTTPGKPFLVTRSGYNLAA